VPVWVAPHQALPLDALKEVPLPVVRIANRGDAKELSQLAERTFRETFAAMKNSVA